MEKEIDKSAQVEKTFHALIDEYVRVNFDNVGVAPEIVHEMRDVIKGAHEQWKNDNDSLVFRNKLSYVLSKFSMHGKEMGVEYHRDKVLSLRKAMTGFKDWQDNPQSQSVVPLIGLIRQDMNFLQDNRLEKTSA